MKTYKEIIKIGQLELRFLMDAGNTNNQMVMFEFIIPFGAKVPVQHYHAEVDEAIYGLEGVLSSIVDGKHIETRPGESLFIPRGVTHHHTNLHPETVNVLCILTPASIGPDYFREVAALVVPGVPPDQSKMVEVMAKYGLIPA